jgi:hypothetical protein
MYMEEQGNQQGMQGNTQKEGRDTNGQFTQGSQAAREAGQRGGQQRGQ